MKKRTIVLVDDDRNILDSLARILWQKDYKLVKCENAMEAWDFINSENGEADVIISDNKMPHIYGTELLIAIRKKYPNIIRIMLTGQSDIEDAKKAINEGKVYRFLTKPCDSDELILIIKHSLAIRDLFLENKRLLEQMKAIKTFEEDVPGIEQLETDNEGRIIIEEHDYITFDDFMKQYIEIIPIKESRKLSTKTILK